MTVSPFDRAAQARPPRRTRPVPSFWTQRRIRWLGPVLHCPIEGCSRLSVVPSTAGSAYVMPGKGLQDQPEEVVVNKRQGRYDEKANYHLAQDDRQPRVFQPEVPAVCDPEAVREHRRQKDEPGYRPARRQHLFVDISRS